MADAVFFPCSSRAAPVLGLCLLCVLLFLSFGCPLEKRAEQHNDLALAEKALRDRDIGDAEMRYERYLRKNPTGDQRWNVWHNLQDIALNIRQDKLTAIEYLEIMLEEYASDPDKRRDIQVRLAALCNEVHAYARAFELWNALSNDEQTPDEIRAVVYRELSRAYLRRLEFTHSTEILDSCLRLNVEPSTKAECLFALSETQMLTGELKASEETLREMLRVDGATSKQQVLAVFMLADVVEQLDRYEEARNLFESIRGKYPNPKVIDIRIAFLRDKKRGKR